MARGRPKGSKNKSMQERMAALMAGGETPLEYMLRVLRDPQTEHARKDEMSKSAAPYMHPRLAATEVSGNADNPIQHRLKIEFVKAGEP
jgi:hypothetical protein